MVRKSKFGKKRKKRNKILKNLNRPKSPFWTPQPVKFFEILVPLVKIFLRFLKNNNKILYKKYFSKNQFSPFFRWKSCQLLTKMSRKLATFSDEAPPSRRNRFRRNGGKTFFFFKNLNRSTFFDFFGLFWPKPAFQPVEVQKFTKWSDTARDFFFVRYGAGFFHFKKVVPCRTLVKSPIRMDLFRRKFF